MKQLFSCFVVTSLLKFAEYVNCEPIVGKLNPHLSEEYSFARNFHANDGVEITWIVPEITSDKQENIELAKSEFLGHLDEWHSKSQIPHYSFDVATYRDMADAEVTKKCSSFEKVCFMLKNQDGKQLLITSDPQIPSDIVSQLAWQLRKGKVLSSSYLDVALNTDIVVDKGFYSALGYSSRGDFYIVANKNFADSTYSALDDYHAENILVVESDDASESCLYSRFLKSKIVCGDTQRLMNAYDKVKLFLTRSDDDDENDVKARGQFKASESTVKVNDTDNDVGGDQHEDDDDDIETADNLINMVGFGNSPQQSSSKPLIGSVKSYLSKYPTMLQLYGHTEFINDTVMNMYDSLVHNIDQVSASSARLYHRLKTNENYRKQLLSSALAVSSIKSLIAHVTNSSIYHGVKSVVMLLNGYVITGLSYFNMFQMNLYIKLSGMLSYMNSHFIGPAKHKLFDWFNLTPLLYYLRDGYGYLKHKLALVFPSLVRSYNILKRNHYIVPLDQLSWLYIGLSVFITLLLLQLFTIKKIAEKNIRSTLQSQATRVVEQVVDEREGKENRLHLNKVSRRSIGCVKELTPEVSRENTCKRHTIGSVCSY